MMTDRDPETRANWVQRGKDAWECTIRSSHGEATLYVNREPTGGYKAFLAQFDVSDPAKSRELMEATLKLSQERDIRSVTLETSSSARVNDMFGVVGQHAVARDIVEDSFEATPREDNFKDVPLIKAIRYLDNTPQGQQRSVVVRAELKDVEIKGKTPREQGDAPPKTREMEKESKNPVREQDSGQTRPVRDITSDKGQSRDPDDDPNGGGAAAPPPTPPTPELPTGGGAANPETGRSLDGPQPGGRITQEVEPVHKAPEGKDPSGKGQSRDPQQKEGPERGVELEPGGKSADSTAQPQSAVQQKLQEMGGREPDGPGSSTEAAKAQAREAVIAAKIKEAREAAKPAKKPGIVSRVADKVREAMPGKAPAKEKELRTGPGLLPAKITPEMQRENDIRKALEARGLSPIDIRTYASQGRSLTESLEAARAREQGEQTNQSAKGKTRDKGKQGPEPVTRDPSIARLAADIQAQAAARAAREVKPPPSRAQELAQERAAKNEKQTREFIAMQSELSRQGIAAYNQYRDREIAQMRERTPGLTLEQAGREFDRLENQRRAQMGRTGRSGPELDRVVEKGGRGD